MNAGAAAAELPLERRFIDTRSAQKWWRICFGGSCGVQSIGDARQQLCTAASCLDAGKCCVAESSVGAGAAAAELPPEQCCIDGRAAQK